MNALDQSLFLAFNLPPDTPAWLVQATLAFSIGLPYALVAALCVVALAARPGWRVQATRVLIAIGVATLAGELLKRGVNHPRPVALGLGTQWQVHRADHSFPSAHATALMAFAVALGLAPVGWLVRGLAVAGALLMGWSRLALGVHFPSDLLAGWLLGAVCAWAVCRWVPPIDPLALWRRLMRRGA